MRNGGKLLVESLISLGASKCFGVPGESYLAVLDALHDTKGTLDYVTCRHEGGASFMAAAYGKLERSPGVCFVTRGPGATNASIGVHTAMQDSVPMLLFVGQVSTEAKDREAFQELDYKAVFGTMAKWAVEIDHVERIPEILMRAWTTAISGRPGPVVVALPEDILSAQTSRPALSGAISIEEPHPNQTQLLVLKEHLQSAKKPLVLMGGGGWKPCGTQALEKFAEASDIPVAAAFRYQDQYDNNLPTYVGELGVGASDELKKAVRDSDLILAINVRFGEMTTNGYRLLSVPEPVQKIIHVHISDKELGKIYFPALAVHAGPNAFSKALLPAGGDWGEWRKKLRSAYEAEFNIPIQPSPVDMGMVMAYLRDHLPDDVILTNGAGNFTVWPGKFFKFGSKARLLGPQSGAMGYGIPAAIAAKVSQPTRTVICFAGDGDFQMNLQELGTAMQHNAQPIILVLNNGIYGTIRAHQERTYPARESGTTIDNPDFVMLSRAYRFYSERVDSADAFPAAFQRALASDTGAVLELTLSQEALSPRVTLSQMREIGLNKSIQS